MEWGLMAEVNPRNLGFILFCALKFSFNTVKSVQLVTRHQIHMLFIIRKYDIVQVCLQQRVGF